MRSLAGILTMAYLAFATMAAAQVSTPAATPTVPELRAVVRYIVNIRLSALGDLTRIDFCAVDALWAPDGSFLARDEAGAQLLYANRADCPAPRPRTAFPTARSVTVRALEARGDSIRAESVSVRGPGLSIFEHYTMVGRRGGSLCCGTYEIYLTVQEDPREQLRRSYSRR